MRRTTCSSENGRNESIGPTHYATTCCWYVYRIVRQITDNNVYRENVKKNPPAGPLRFSKFPIIFKLNNIHIQSTFHSTIFELDQLLFSVKKFSSGTLLDVPLNVRFMSQTLFVHRSFDTRLHFRGIFIIRLWQFLVLVRTDFVCH